MQNSQATDPNQQHFDVAIIGGGINGASTAQHLSAAGYRVLVVEQGDFADGATSRSSRLLHCGLRHLASGSGFWQTLMHPRRLATAIATVRHDMLARDEIVHSIPNRVKPINFCLPIYSDDPFAPWQLDMAFATMRLTSPRGEPLDYRRYKRSEFDQVPISSSLRNPEKLRSIAVFREYLFDWPERIALDALFDARRMGADIRNYTRVTELKRTEESDQWHLYLEPTNGAENSSPQQSSATANMVFNLSGAWVDKVTSITGSHTSPKCTGIKGIHIALRLPDEFSDWGVFAYNSLGEPLYCLPFRGIHYVGLTRTPFSGNIADVSATDQEIDWMIGECNRCFPNLAFTRDDVLFSWAGVNPLTRDDAEPLGSREIKLHDMTDDGLPGLVTLTGGPIMTHRRMARAMTKLAMERLSPSNQPQSPIYHSASTSFDHDPSSNNPLIPQAEIERCAIEEMPANLADLIMRRLGLGWQPDQGLSQARRVAEIAASAMGWSEGDVENQLSEYRKHLSNARRSGSK